MTIADLVALKWHPFRFDGDNFCYMLQFRQYSFRFLRADEVCVAEHYRHGTLQGRDFGADCDDALAKLCARQHSSGVTLGEWLRGLT